MGIRERGFPSRRPLKPPLRGGFAATGTCLLTGRRGYGRAVSPRHVPASVTELARVGLFAGLPGETLGKLADRMEREEVASGTVLIREGEPGDRFFVLLSGVAGVSQTALGERRILKAGEFFGEVALTMHVPRTATVTAMTPCVVASCDEPTFDELVRPLFADD
jgi:hypothetical protein